MKTDNISIMKLVLRLAGKARGMTSPNPMVGAVLLKAGKIIADDYHRKPGAPHAEALVIGKAGDKAKGSTLYVNLEPCCHTDKRTPPCTKAIIASGIKKVIIGMKDPNPKVAGKGIEELRKAGIETVSGILEDESKRLNEAYIKHITTKEPFVILKVAMTLDGKIATPEGESKWITGEKARSEVHKLRSGVDAILTAIGTVKTDDPLLTARVRGLESSRVQVGKNPKRIIIDPNLEIPMDARILQTPPETIIVANSKGQVAKGKKEILSDRGIKIIEYDGEKLDLKWLMKKLGGMEINSLLIEGGSSLNSYALEAGIIDKVMFFIAPKIIGGRESFPCVGGKTFRKLPEAHKLKDINVKRIGEDILIEGYLK
ncbi:MAG: bifunctional diaminohydroxyphosphoribosylaminopyrimidine deaminase/5-amino-6-(5-phosphoribosylamino)uracil reductase RibD [Nitrospirae bacterium]|nr:MAG: bifunctional diaminohydroxyphosphoribosylaminopyrimidine deaminase/5-amino-6-(5-phosphoribosylamino)uracil reductase RibD [Nitrospirota bacterium]